MRVGVDFGTTRTVVAAAIDGRYPVAAFEVDSTFQEYLPGFAVAAPRLTFGSQAECNQNTANAVLVRSIKRSACQVPHNEAVPELTAFGISALELVTQYLSFVRTMLFEHSNLDLEPGEPLEAMVSVPANASTRQRYLTLEAFRRAGFSVLGMVNEPTAAAIEFARRHLGVLARRSPKRYVLVYDLGGGTFDSAAVSLQGRRFELIASAGISRLGGDDFDELILELALQTLGYSADTLDATSRILALEVCRQAKEGLSPNSRRLLVDLSAVLPKSADVNSQLAIVDTSTLYERVQPLVDRTVEKLTQVFSALADHGIDADNPRELGALYLVGGATAFPSIARTLRRLHGKKIQLAPQPHAATAIGLAVAADPRADIFVRESTTRYFGLWREAFAGKEQVFDPIVSKNQAPEDGSPLVVERWYRPVHAIGHLRFLECSDLGADGQPAGDLTPWKEIFVRYDPSIPSSPEALLRHAGERRSEAGDEIVERYVYELDGSIRLVIANRTRGYEQTYLLGQLG